MSDNNELFHLLPYTKEDIFTAMDFGQNMGWQITAFNLPEVWKYTKGAGVTVAIIDSGIDLEHPDLVSSIVPGKNFVETDMLPFDSGEHGCVSPDALIHTNRNGIESIEEFYDLTSSEEEAIKTTDGIYYVKKLHGVKTFSYDTQNKKVCTSEIESVQKLKIKDEIVNIKLDGGTEFKLTPWHPVYTIKHKAHKKVEIIRKRADEVCCGDCFIFGNGSFDEKIKISLPVRYSCANCNHRPLYWLEETPSKCKKCQRTCWTIYNDEIEIDENLAYLCGIVLTDGHMQPGSNRFEVTSNTKEILEKVATISEINKWNYEIQKNRILVYGKTAVNTLAAMGINLGRKSLTQKLPSWTGRASRSVVCSFLAGVIDGDGCISSTNTRNRIISASLDFSSKTAALLNSLGYSSFVKGPIFDTRQRFITSKNPVYHVQFSSVKPEIAEHMAHPNKVSRAAKQIIGRKSRTVASVEKSKYDGYFYDFTVKEYHNYIANGHFVSNTHVAGIIAANDNKFGVVGVAPDCKIMPLKVLNSYGQGKMEHVVEAIRYATDHGADIISMSLGCRNPVDSVLDAIKYASSKNTVCFVAAGNAGSTKQLLYPAAYPECISIGAVDEQSMRADFSCTGPNLDFVAPGVKIFSTVPKSSYAYLSGTSMACPFAVGVAVLVLAEQRLNNPSAKLSIDDYRKILSANCLPIKNLDTNLDKNGARFWQGMGIINPSQFESWVEYRNVEDIKREILVLGDKIDQIKKKNLLKEIVAILKTLESKIVI